MYVNGYKTKRYTTQKKKKKKKSISKCIKLTLPLSWLHKKLSSF